MKHLFELVIQFLFMLAASLFAAWALLNILPYMGV